MMRWLLALAALAPAAWVQAAGSLPLARDLGAEARAASREGLPLVILYSLPGCPHCEVVRRSHLLPLLAEKPPRARAVQIDLGSHAPLIDFAGRTTTHGEYSRQQKVVLAPVVAFVDGQGRPLANALVGSLIPDFYGAYLDEALAESMRKSGTADRPSGRRPNAP